MNYCVIFIILMVISMIIQVVLKSKFNKYSKVALPGGLTGADVAARMLAGAGINDVTIRPTNGTLTDFYDPRSKTVNLSEGVYASNSIAAAAIAAHECGHAIQHKVGYGPLRMRSALVPVVTFANNIVMWVLLLGILLIEVFPGLFWAGIALFAMTTLFSFITLPVEINASKRAVKFLTDTGVIYESQRSMAVDALKWAAYTYVIAALSSLATLLYYISIGNSRR